MTPQVGLGRLQEAFARALAGGEDGDIIARLVGDEATARRQLAIYRSAVASNAAGALQAAFPVVARLVGEAYFGEAAARYAEREPSTSGDLNRYGGAFPGFLATYPHAGPLPWLADVARLEWSWHESLMAADAYGLDLAALAGVAEDDQLRVRFVLHPSVRLVRSRWPVLAIWEANQPGQDGAAARDSGSDAVLVWREGPRVRLALLPPPEAEFLERLAHGMTLEAAADVAGEWDLPATLRRFAEHHVFCGFTV